MKRQCSFTHLGHVIELWFCTPVLYIYAFPFPSINNGKPGNQLHLLMWLLAKNLFYFGNMLVVPVDFMQWGHWYWCTHVMFFWNTPMSSKYASRCRNRKAILVPQRWRKNWHWMTTPHIEIWSLNSSIAVILMTIARAVTVQSIAERLSQVENKLFSQQLSTNTLYIYLRMV